MKKIFTFMAVFALAMAASAQTVSIYAEFDKTEKCIDVKLKNDKLVSSFSFKFLLPEGVSVVTETEDGETYELWDRDEDRVKDTKKTKWSMDIRDAAEGYTMVTCYGGPGVAAGDGAIFHIPVTCTKGGTVNFKDAQVYIPSEVEGEKGTEINFDPFTCEIETAIKSISADETKSGVIYNMAGQRVNKAVKGVYVVDGKKVAVK
jgi:hypothetical protein